MATEQDTVSKASKSVFADAPVNAQNIPPTVTIVSSDPDTLIKKKRQDILISCFVASPLGKLSRTKRSRSVEDEGEQKCSKKVHYDTDSENGILTEYDSDIFRYFYERELDLLPQHDYLADKQCIYYLRPKLRAILIDWLVQVHWKFQNVTETLLLTINIMDRFLSNNKVKLAKLQLVAITCLFIASKFQEITMPKLSNFVYVTDGAATADEIKLAEFQILHQLNFEITWPNPLNFIRRLSKADKYDQDTRTTAKLLLEYAYCSPLFTNLKPSLIAAICMYTARRFILSKVDGDEGVWNQNFLECSGQIDADNDRVFQNLALELINELAYPTTKLESLIDKYRKETKSNIHSLVQKWCKNYISK
ncbi:uncharacterized protein KNAG_0B00960 [Huiozyma naganishii CBS 8797]|uniref:Cyclin N-terminal domain-containing protein n=1 Tax=Huiozyma naganishii (strain ATCC MYA-139 / BCRC 22969 / CBS 8797 / KCTC 17520 / NBRC 10181 / NCYC 3082 / Yp74L-3) TaxID=1071383 RepID=J7RG81_HUIN7|nr:hypothetical protein KNAG_0B00960 [Kazachstania naganishii CBS 8797]CCK68543.1 hypothetical protein KNAG_0B00960 [Kazachstania naganishii CBS 8797]